LSIVGDEEIGPTVLIEIEHGDTQGFGAGVKNAAGGGDIFKSAVAAIVKEPAGFAAIGLGSAIGFIFSIKAAENIMFGRPVDVIADEEIEKAVAVVIKPERRSAEGLMRGETAGFCDVDKLLYRCCEKDDSGRRR
jgi:hypothetical protein